jgi:hypothetical protein
MTRVRLVLPHLPILALSFVTFLLTAAGQCQILSVGDLTSAAIEGAGHDYIKMLSETVNPANGSLSLRIQAPPAKRRGITLPFSFNYDSNGVSFPAPNGPGLLGAQSNLNFVSQGGWGYSLPVLNSSLWSSTSQDGGQGGQTVTCYFSSNYTFQDPTGGRHNLGLAAASYASSGSYLCSSPVLSGGDPQYAASLITTETSGNVEVPVQVTDADGTVPSGTTNIVSVSGMTYKVAWTTATANYTFPYKVAWLASGDVYCNPSVSITGGGTVVSSITLPNNQVCH